MLTICIKPILPYFKVNNKVNIEYSIFTTSNLNFDISFGRNEYQIKGELTFKYKNKLIYERFIRNIIKNESINNYFKQII